MACVAQRWGEDKIDLLSVAVHIRVVWSGTASSSPSRRMIEPISPSVWRRPRRNTARSVSAVVIARAE